MRERRYRGYAARAAMIYVILAVLWILLSDTIVGLLPVNLAQAQTAKGLFFVLITGLGLYLIMSRWVEKAERYEGELEQSREDYRSLFAANPHPMFVYELATLRFLAVNDAAVAKYGYTQDEFLSMTIADIRPPSDVPALMDNVAEVDGSLDRAGTWRHLTKDNALLWVDITSHGVEFEGRKGEVVLAMDVTETREAREALHRSNQRMRAMLDASPLAIVVLDDKAQVTLWNPTAEQMFGWSQSEVMGERLPIVPEGAWEEFEQRFEGSRRGEVSLGLELRRKTKAGRLIDVSLNAAPILSEEGEFESEVLILSDISDDLRTEEELKDYRLRLEDIVTARTDELRRVNEHLRRATRVKDEFLANMSHELRTPLNSIIGFSGILTQGMAGELNDEQAKQAEMINKAGRRLLELINDILDLSKIEAGRTAVDAAEFDAAETVRELVMMMKPEAEKRGLSVDVETPGPAPLFSDQVKVRQIVTNLLSNAVKFTQKGHIRVRVGVVDGDCEISVADSGPGIHHDEVVSIFDEFTQAARRADVKPVGTGLGLAISRKLARLLGGDVLVVSEPGVGSTFTLRIPVRWQSFDRGTTAAFGNENDSTEGM